MTGPTGGDAQDAYDAASLREVEQGRLPLRAQERLATLTEDRAFTSDLSSSEFHAVRAVGFLPLGQVMGLCVYQLGHTGLNSCGHAKIGGSTAAQEGTIDAEPLTRAMLTAKARAENRLLAETKALGGDGVVAVRFAQRHLTPGAVEFCLVGTAVRSSGPNRPKVPFTSDLTGQQFAQLITSSWTPVGLVFGVSARIRHDDYPTRRITRSLSSREIPGYTALLHDARSDARRQLTESASRLGADTVILRQHNVWVAEKQCANSSMQDHVVQCVMVGTAVAHVSLPLTRKPAAPLQMLRLSRATARTNGFDP